MLTLNVRVNNSKGYSLIYPNPASDVLNIVFKQADQQNLENNKTTVQDTRRYYKLYNSQGVLKRDISNVGQNTQLNISDLPNGIYYLNIFEDLNAKPDVHTVIIEH